MSIAPLNVYGFLVVATMIYLMELLAFMLLFYLVAVTVGWPIKKLFVSLKTIIGGKRIKYD